MAEQSTLTDERKRLTNEREATVQEIQRLRESVLTEFDFEVEDGDPQLIEREKNVSLLRTFEQRLDEIDSALEAIEDGTYGTCERCGKQIDPERLRIMPETKLCVSCKSILEKQRRGYS